MTMLLMEGFEGYETLTDLKRRYLIQNGGVDALVAGRLGGRAYKPGSSDLLYMRDFGNAGPSGVVGFAVRYTGNSIAAGSLCQLIGLDGNDHMTLAVLSGGTVVLRKGLTQIDSSPISMLQGDWTYFEFKYTINNSTGSYEIRMDGQTVMSDTSVDTQDGADTEVRSVVFFKNSGGNEEYDDIYIIDNQGGVNDDFLGDIQVETMVPDADGNRNEFTRVGGGSNNFEAVDDGDTPDDDSTYNHSATLDDTELYGHAAMTATFDTVFAIQVRNHCRKENAGDRHVRSLIRSNTNEAEGADQVLSVDWRYLDDIYETDPQGSGVWTETRINALEAGFTIEA